MLFVSDAGKTILGLVLAITMFFGLLVSVTAKAMVDAWLHQRIPILGSFVGLSPSENPGIAFGILLPDAIEIPLIFCALILVGFFARASAKTRWSSIGFGLILGGAFGNILDRIPDGLVTDFIQVGTFPIFNIADSCITVGVAMLLLEQFVLFRSRKIL